MDQIKESPSLIRLIPKRKHGLKKLLFSRVGFFILLIFIQLALVLVISEYAIRFRILALFMTVFLIVMFVYLFNTDMDSSAKLTWSGLFLFFPVPAALFLLFTQLDVGHRKEKRRLNELVKGSRKLISQNSYTIIKQELIDSGTADLCFYLNRSGRFPIYENTEVTFFPLGEDKYNAMLPQLKAAEKFIFLEYFIIDEGLMWGNILNILIDKAAHGVDVRVMYDGMCEISTLTHNYPKLMQQHGIKCKAFSRIRPFVSTSYNYRDHRKILVIDGKVAFNGGVNLADEYINRVERFGHWKDTAIMLKGEAVQSFTLMFLQMWNMTEAQPGWDECSISFPSKRTDGFVMPYCDNPLDDEKVGESVYMDIINRSISYIHIMTPYLILDNELENALTYAAKRGVEVKIILPGIPDKKSAYALAKTHYRSLTKAGVKIYEYTPGFVHAKVFVSDNRKAVVGTINLDYRSLYHHFECATYLYRTACIKEIEEDFQRTLLKCRKVTLKTIADEKLGTKIRGRILKLFAPLM
ncbi:cardiolipin synthase [Ruminococcus sp. FC2018]|uniref:cardiolipin synthase n=1 Tax=Ruminococcus sp. FC2018 TaxID=1410617 RepID=UPI000684D5FF|nr:cardiolipin synthase [Ruminococcus sp. FC2018]